MTKDDDGVGGAESTFTTAFAVSVGVGAVDKDVDLALTNVVPVVLLPETGSGAVRAAA